MLCYNCGCQLSEHDFCTACGADVALYKKIIYASNRCYNDGLEKAKVRDLSGAVNSLRQSLKLNKNNIKARNLLGLVYFEMGEVVAALSEWVISKNFRPGKNIANNYIDIVQSSATRLDTLNQTIKKYNLAYQYCRQDSKDLAVIQLKKVLSLNPKFLRAHQLLALLYLDQEEWNGAERELRKCLRIDRNNTIALNYLEEVNRMLAPKDGQKAPERNRQQDETVRYQSDNEVIIQPVNVKEPRKTAVSTVLNIAIGLIIGMAAMYFLVMPGRLSAVTDEANRKVTEIGSQLDDKTAAILDLEQQVKELQNEKAALEEEVDGIVGANGTLDTIDRLLLVASSYLDTKDVTATGEALEEFSGLVDITQTSEAVQKLYDSLVTAIGPELGGKYYDAGTDALRQNLFAEAVANLEKAVQYDASNVEALYELGNAYRENGDREKAVETYQKLIETFPNSNRVRRAQSYIDQLSEE